MFLVFPTHEHLAQYVSLKMVDVVRQKASANLGLATGSTMEPVYEQFIQAVRQYNVDVSKLHSFNLDEYVGLSAQHPQSYNYYMEQHLFQHLPFYRHQLHLPDGLCDDVDAQCAWYSQRIAELGGIDFQLLGVGTNGHIGFNEPQTPFTSRTHVVSLSERTRLDNGRFFKHQAEVPTLAITLGIQDIMDAHEVWLLVTGEHKAATVLRYYQSAVDEAMPATVLKDHANARVLLDEKAASLLPEKVKLRISADQLIEQELLSLNVR